MLLSLPYSIELNDISMMIVQHHPAREFVTRCMDYFERLYEESKSRAKIMSIAVHPYISGTPYRIKYFEQVLAAAEKEAGRRVLDRRADHELVSDKPRPSRQALKDLRNP